MVNLDKNTYIPKAGDATITKVEEGTVYELLPTDRIPAFKNALTFIPKSITTEADKEAYRENRLKEQHIQLTMKMANGQEFSSILKIPKPSKRGFNDSNLVKMIKAYDLPTDTKDWVGHSIKFIVSSGGYPKIDIPEQED